MFPSEEQNRKVHVVLTLIAPFDLPSLGIFLWLLRLKKLNDKVITYIAEHILRSVRSLQKSVRVILSLLAFLLAV